MLIVNGIFCNFCKHIVFWNCKNIVGETVRVHTFWEDLWTGSHSCHRLYDIFFRNGGSGLNFCIKRCTPSSLLILSNKELTKSMHQKPKSTTQ
jgi:hypothetical protein